jgi:hypoxanthine phosphoribosyltransferase
MPATAEITRPRSSAYTKYLSASERSYMTMQEAIALSHDLADVIEDAGAPQMLVGVANGALLPLKIVADQLKIPFHVIYIRRKGSRYKQKIYAIKQALHIPTWLLTLRPVRVIQTLFEQQTSSLEETDDAFDFDVRGKDVVIVDDAVHTGQTARHLKDRLAAKGARDVKVAVICWYQGKTDSGNWSPDLYLHRYYHWYPWSNNNPEFPDFLTWLNSQGLRFWR